MTLSNNLNFAFVRLNSVAPHEITAHMSDPRMKEHMPLLSTDWNEANTQMFLAAKEESWRQHGLGHWAFLSKGLYVGWGGFQKEGDEWDFGLVLKRDCFGMGPAIARHALDFAKNDSRIPYITFLLPPSRTRLGALNRLGAHFITQIQYEGLPFLKFRLETPNDFKTEKSCF